MAKMVRVMIVILQFGLHIFSASADAASPFSKGHEDTAQPHLECTHAVEVAHSALQVCSGLPVEDALLKARLQKITAREVGVMLAGLGFRTALTVLVAQCRARSA
jgi:hypothetical protein